MLALYCQTKYRERRHRNHYETEIIEYYNNLEIITEDKNTDLPKCRVCLQSASVYIYNQKNKEQIIEALKIFGNIDLNSEDQCPKHLCRLCLKFIQEAILFRKTAVKSSKNLNIPEKSKVFSSNGDKSDDFSGINKSHCINPNDDNLYHEDQIQFDSKHDENDEIAEEAKNWDLQSNTTDEFSQENEDNANKTEKEKKMITCNICDRVMEIKYYYNHHIPIHNPETDNKKKYICDKCGKKFKTTRALLNHRAIHTGSFPFKCDYCPYRGRNKSSLDVHLRIHIGIKKHLCTYCPAQFYSTSNLKRHMFIHEAPQFQCNECDRAFHTQFLLKKHVDVDHLGIKPHVCEVCGKAFGYKKKLREHLKGVHKRPLLQSGRMPAYLLEKEDE